MSAGIPVEVFDDFTSRFVEICANCLEQAPEAGDDWCQFCILNDSREQEAPGGGDDFDDAA